MPKSGERITRAEAQPYVDRIEEALIGQRYVLCGSWRRKCETVGDIDVLVIGDNGFGRLGGWSLDTFVPTSDGSKSLQGELWIAAKPVHIDFWFIQPDAVGAFLQFATGPMKLNLVLRSKAQRRGWKLSQYWLKDAMGNRLDASEGTDHEREVSVFEAFGMNWIEPEERDDPKLWKTNQSRGV